MQPNDQPLDNPTPQTPTNPNTTPLSKTPINRSRKIIYLSLTILLILLATITGIYLLSKSVNPSTTSNNSPLNNAVIQKLAEKMPIPKITMTLVTRTPSPTLDPNQPTPQPTLKTPTIDSQSLTTYNNTNLNFSISYPSNLTVKENDHGLGVTDISFANTGNSNSQNSPDYQILIYPITIGKLIGQDFDALYSLPPNTTQRMSSENIKPQLYTKLNNRSINNYKAFDFQSTDDPPDPYIEPETGTYIEFGESIIIISTGENNRANLDQMLSTFKP